MEIYTISGAAFGATTCPPGWTPTPNGNCGGPAPRYYLKAAADLQAALRGLGARVGDAGLASLPIDGIVGPATVQAAERAFSTHIGPGQAPAALRAGGLGILGVAQSASVMADLANAETTRRGGALVTTPPPPKGTVRVEIGPAEIMTEPSSRKMWALVGLNALAATIGIYFVATRDS
jgi:hypothetical protein